MLKQFHILHFYRSNICVMFTLGNDEGDWVYDGLVILKQSEMSANCRTFYPPSYSYFTHVSWL